MNVALTWADPTNPPGSAAQAIRGHVIGLQSAGHDVDVFYGEYLNELPNRQDEYDLVIWPSNLFAARQIMTLDEPHLHFHFIGVDTPGNPTAFKEAMRHADTFSAVDPNCAIFFNDLLDLDLAATAIIPNAPNTDVFTSCEPTEGYAFVPKSGASQKDGTGLADVAELTPNTLYETHAAGGLPNMPFNVRVRPPVPWSLMQRRYKGASFVVNPSQHEGLPNVCYESFLSERAYVARESAIGRLQTIPESELDVSSFGESAEYWNQSHSEFYYTGDHYLASESMLHKQIRKVTRNIDYRDEIAAKGREWVESLADRWSWKDVSETMIETVEVNG